MKCYHCDAELIWGCDHMPIESDEYQMETNLSCPDCDSFYLVYLPYDDEEDDVGDVVRDEKGD